MMTELLRRALCGSVTTIDDELQVQVAQKVDATVAQRLPKIEQAAAEVADKAARVAATEVTFEGIRSLEQRSKEAERGIVAHIETTARDAEEKITKTAATLSGRIEEVEKNAEQAITTKSNELASSMEQAIVTKGHELATSIEAAERRANELAHAEIARHVEELMARSRKTVSGMKDKLQTLDTTAASLTKGVQQLEKERRRAEEDLRRELNTMRQLNETLAARVADLEKPRGLRGLWAKFAGGKAKSDEAADATA